MYWFQNQNQDKSSSSWNENLLEGPLKKNLSTPTATPNDDSGVEVKDIPLSLGVLDLIA